jgi:hypothetical protein
VPRHRPVGDLGRPLADQDLRADELLGPPSGARPRHPQRPSGAQAGAQGTAQRAAALDVQGLVDGLVRGPHRLIMGEVDPQPVGDLFRAPRPGPAPVLAAAVPAPDPPHLRARHRRAVGRGDQAGKPVLHVHAQCVVLAGQPVRDRLPEPQPMLTPRHRRPARRPHRRPSCRRRSPTPWSSHPHPRCSGCCDDQLNPPTYGLCRVKEAQAPRAPSVAHALHHIMAAQRRRRRKAKWCCVRCHEASSLANLWQLRTDRPPRTRQAPYWVVRAVFKMST